MPVADRPVRRPGKAVGGVSGAGGGWVAGGDVIPPQRLARGDLELAMRPDLDRPMRVGSGVQVGYHQVEGLRVRTGAAYLFAKGTITADLANVADRYVETVERMHGANDAEWMGETGGAFTWRGHPTETQIEAAGLLRVAVDRVGKGPMGLIGAVMLDGQTLVAMGVLLGEDRKAVVGRLRAALERLGEVWEMKPLAVSAR